MKLEFLEDFYVEELKDLYNSEKQILHALPKIAHAASSGALRKLLEDHVDQTRTQVSRLEQILKSRGENGPGRPCKGMAGLIDEANDLLKRDASPEITDVGIIAATQKIEHYEIAGYGCATTYAKMLGFEEEAALLHQTLDEEKAADGLLTVLAKEMVNLDAATGETEVDLREAEQES